MKEKNDTPAQLASVVTPGSALAIAMSDKNAMQTLGSIFVAKQMPRNLADVEAKIKALCAHEKLAEKAFFSYDRGNSKITGETIHLANACMTAYGNVEAGWAKTGETVNEKGITCSTCEAYCFDKENNIIRKASFMVPHYREIKGGKGYVLTSDRDIYELCANMAARRMRACIFGIIPEFLKDLAAEQCKKTLERDNMSIEERIKMMVEKFSLLGVTEEMLEKKLGNKLSECTKNQIIYLRNLYNALSTKIVSVEEQFKDKEDAVEEDKEKKKNVPPVFKKKGQEDKPVEGVIDPEVVTGESDLNLGLDDMGSMRTPFDD